MNWTILLVVAVVAVLVPVALVATFSSTRDTYCYARHYGKTGFTQEVQSEGETPGVPANESELLPGSTQQDHRETAPVGPVSEWPREL